MSTTTGFDLPTDRKWRERARAVIPNGMYGHQNANSLPEGFPQFMERGDGCHVWDIDGNKYIDFMCSYGPIVLGHHDPVVDEAVRLQTELADCQNGPSHLVVELSELLVKTVKHADWAMFSKNGTDATTSCVTIARAATGKRKILVAKGAYHGAAPWCTPNPAGVLPEDRQHLDHFIFNDIESVKLAVERSDSDLAGIVISPFRHDARFDQELVAPDFARYLRKVCDETGAALILDDVRCGFRLAFGGSWEPIGVDPDLSAWSKAIANGYSLACVLGNDKFREGAGKIFVTGSFWFSAVSMAACIATIGQLENCDGLTKMVRAGQRLRDGFSSQAKSYGLEINQTGPPQMPLVTFKNDKAFAMANVWSGEAAKRGVYLHPWHNMFLCAAHKDEDIDAALLMTDDAFAAVRSAFGAN